MGGFLPLNLGALGREGIAGAASLRPGSIPDRRQTVNWDSITVPSHLAKFQSARQELVPSKSSIPCRLFPGPALPRNKRNMDACCSAIALRGGPDPFSRTVTFPRRFRNSNGVTH